MIDNTLNPNIYLGLHVLGTNAEKEWFQAAKYVKLKHLKKNLKLLMCFN